MTDALATLVAAVEAALDDRSLTTDAQRVEAFAPAMRALLNSDQPIPAEAHEPFEGGAVGNLLHADPDGRFHVLAVVFPEGTSSGVHFHGCWGLIGYLRGGDEETRYRHVGDQLEEASRHVWHQGDVTALLPPDDGWHRVRNPGPGVGVSVHVLCMTPAAHPHQYWNKADGRILPFPFQEVAPGRWVARVEGV